VALVAPEDRTLETGRAVLAATTGVLRGGTLVGGEAGTGRLGAMLGAGGCGALAATGGGGASLSIVEVAAPATLLVVDAMALVTVGTTALVVFVTVETTAFVVFDTVDLATPAVVANALVTGRPVRSAPHDWVGQAAAINSAVAAIRPTSTLERLSLNSSR
jgi:hypothetical protein